MPEPRNESQDHSSTEEEWRNKRLEQDFLSGLAEAGLSWDEALAIWWAARRRPADTGEMADQSSTIESIHAHQDGRLRLDDLNILVSSPEHQCECLEAAQWPEQKDYESAAVAYQCLPISPSLVLVTDAESSAESPRLRKVHFVGPARFQQSLEAMLTRDNWVEDLDLSLTNGRHRVLLSAEPRHRATAHRLDDLVGRILDIALIEGRPLTGYDCTFLLPLDLRLDDELEKPDLFQPKPGSTLFGYGIEEFHLLPPGEVLGEHLTSGDPARDFYRCDDNHNRDEHCEQVRHAQAYEYLFSGLREHLYTLAGRQVADGQIEPLRQFRLTFDGIEGMAIRLDADPRSGKPVLQVPLRDVSLYRYYNGVLVLGIRVALSNQLQTSRNLTEPDWWKALVFPQNDADRELPERQVNRLLRYSKLVRQLFAAFAEQLQESKIGGMQLVHAKTNKVQAQTAVGDPFNGIVEHFLRAFFPRIPGDDWTRERRFRHLIDDRMFVSLAYALAGRPPQPESAGYDRLERLFSLALYVDEASDGYELAHGHAYDRAFIEALKLEHRLTRWDQIGTREGVSPYSMVLMGQSSYFNNVVLATHVPYIYTRILIVLLLYRTTLYQFDRRITRATEELTQRKRPGTFRRMRQDFIQFTNIYWLRELTPQIQGQELTDRAVKVLRLEPKYALLKDEMERADEFIAARRDRRFSIVALWLAVIAIVLSFDEKVCPFSAEAFWQILQNSSLLGLVLVLLYVAIWPSLKAFFKRLIS